MHDEGWQPDDEQPAPLPPPRPGPRITPADHAVALTLLLGPCVAVVVGLWAGRWSVFLGALRVLAVVLAVEVAWLVASAGRRAARSGWWSR